MDRLSREYRASVAVPILCALLATGHFTRADDLPLKSTNGDWMQLVKRVDCFETFAADGFARRHMSVAVLTALSLAKELIDQTELEAEKQL